MRLRVRAAKPKQFDDALPVSTDDGAAQPVSLRTIVEAQFHYHDKRVRKFAAERRLSAT